MTVALEEPINTEWYVPRLLTWPLNDAPQVLMCTDYNCFVMGSLDLHGHGVRCEATPPSSPCSPSPTSIRSCRRSPSKASWSRASAQGSPVACSSGLRHPKRIEEARIQLGSAQVVAPLAFFAWLHPMKSWGTHEA